MLLWRVYHPAILGDIFELVIAMMVGRNNYRSEVQLEMEKDTINAHGASKFLRQKFYNDSDKFPIYICRNCGKPAIVNFKLKFFNCSRCEDNADIVKVNSSWVSKNLFHHFNAMGVDVKYELNDYFSV